MIRNLMAAAVAVYGLSLALAAQAPVTAPYLENFDSESTCIQSTTAPCPLIGPFIQDPNDAGDWIVNTGGTGSINTGPSFDHTTGSGNYLFTETSGAVVGSERRLVSPPLDLVGVANPQFSFWYHMFGSQMGTMHVDILQQINVGTDGVTLPGGAGVGTFTSNVSLFTTGIVGDTLTITGSTGNDGVYTIASIVDDFTVTVTPDFTSTETNLTYSHDRLFLDVIPSFTDNMDVWQKVSVPIVPSLQASGNTLTARAVIRGVAGSGLESDMAIDDFSYQDAQPDDVGVVAITAPSTELCVGSYNVTATIENFGTNTQTNFAVSLLVNGALVVSDTITTLAGGAQTSLTFSMPATFAAGISTVDVVTTLTNDLVPANDLVSVNVNAVAIINSFPYFEDFEGGQAGWSIGGPSTTWAFGTPGNGVINGAASGVNAFAVGNLTGLYNNNEDGFVKSPCFDLSSLNDPFVSVRVWWNSEFSWDGMNLQASTDGGATWNNIGVFGDPDNWYTDDTIVGAPGGSQEGWSGRDVTNNGSGGYVVAVHDLQQVLGASAVEFRMTFGTDPSVQAEGVAFDDFRVFDLIVPFPGSNGDLVLEHGVNGPPDAALGGEIKTVSPGSFVSVRTSSPSGSYVGFPYALIADAYNTAGGPPAAIDPNFPEVHISSSAVVVLDGNSSAGGGGLNWGIAPNGSELNFAVLDPFLVGTSVLIQSLVLDSAATNGFFTITDGKVFQIQ